MISRDANKIYFDESFYFIVIAIGEADVTCIDGGCLNPGYGRIYIHTSADTNTSSYFLTSGFLFIAMTMEQTDIHLPGIRG